MRITIQDLHYVIALADTLHFGKAAQRCHVTQPNLSNQLKSLENRLGNTLFERSRQQVGLTSFGQRFVDRARHIVMQMSELEALVSDPFSGDIHIGLFPTLAPYFLPVAMPILGAAFPKIKFMLREDKTPTIVDALQKGELDCIFAAEPLALPMASRRICEDIFFLAVYPAHPFAQKTVVSFAELQEERLLLLSDGHCLREQALSLCQISGAVAREDYRATSLETLRYMVAAGVGITVMPQMACRDNDGLVYIPFSGEAPRRKISLFWRKMSQKTALFEAMGEALAEAQTPA